MHKFYVLALSIALMNTSFSQEKIYSTKSGTISINANTPLETIEATNNQTLSKLSDKSGQLVFMLLIKGFTFKNALMQEHFNENYMESSKFPKADFKGNITNLNDVNFSKDGSYNVKVEGTLTIHGVSKKMNTTGTIIVDKGKVKSSASFKIKVRDFGIAGKYIGDKIAEEVETTIVCKYD
jgi:hypothetical protein